jgi:hypothetical protein
MANKVQSLESLALLNGKRLTEFFTKKKDKDITAIASYYGRKVHTERLIVIEGSKESPKANTLIKVTIIE